MSWETFARGALWSLATLGCYLVARQLHRRWHRIWTAPLLVAPLLLGAWVVASGTSYRDYAAGAGWLVAMLGPTTVAFAEPIYRQRALLRQHWAAVLGGALAASATSVVTTWWLASALGIDGTLRQSLLPRSTSTPFAMEVSAQLGGVPEITAVFVAITGVLGAMLGEVLLARWDLRSPLARGALLGAGAHGVGTARAQEYGSVEGVLAALLMVTMGILNVLVAPLLAQLLPR